MLHLFAPQSGSSRLLCSKRCMNPAQCRPALRVVRCFKDTTNSSVWSEIPLQTNYSVAEKDELLQRAETELSSFCSQLPDDHEARKCWETFDYLRKKHSSYSSGCALEVTSGSPAENCQQLEELDQLVRELESTGSVQNVYHVLNIMKRMESDEHTTNVISTSAAPKEDARDQELLRGALELFDQVDTNHDGKIDAGEFEAAMTRLSPNVAGELEVIFDCLDVHGFVDRQQFIDIVLAEKARLQNPGADAEFLKHLTHYHPHSGHA